MEGLLTSSSSGSDIGGNKSDCSIGLGDGNKNGTGRQFWEQSVSKSSSPNYRISRLTEEGEYESAKREMTQVREENARLKKMLEQVERDYRSLHSRLIGIKQQQQQSTTSVINSSPSKNNPQSKDTNFEEPELVSLSLGRSPRSTKRDDQITKTKQNLQQLDKDRGLKLGLDFDLEGSTSKSEDSSELETAAKEVEEQAGEISPWPPSKLLKTMTSTGEDEASPQREVKRARVSVRARCDSATMNDGCQWRKYGQKIAKGNPCPRAYYRCTVAPSCPVRKQVQRCVEDMSILITTYEGTHNHPLPVSATAMASTTSAAASMVLSGSSTSATSPTNFHGLNFNLTHNPSTTPFYIPNASSQAFSTITLDLTTSTPTPHFNMFSPRFPSTNMGLSSSETNTLPHTWGNGYPNYGTLPLNTTTNGSLNSSQFYQSYTEKNSHVSSSQQILTETLTKAITSDPSLRSVINAAISSMVSDGGENGVNGCASSYLSRSLSSISQPGNLMHIQQAPLPFSISKKNSMSAADGRDQIN